MRGRSLPSGVESAGLARTAGDEQTRAVNTVNTVIFDLGGVLSLTGRPSDVIRRFPDHEPDVVMRVMMGEHGTDGDHPWHRLERGEVSLDEYSSLVGRLVAEAGLVPREPLPPSDGKSTIRVEFRLSEPMFELVHDLRRHGCRLGVLTNNVRELRERWWGLVDFPALFDDVVDSHEVGLRKPNPEIYRLALRRLGASAGEAAFLDDILANVAAARDLGMHGILVEDDQSPAIRRVRDLTGLSS